MGAVTSTVSCVVLGLLQPLRLSSQPCQREMHQRLMSVPTHVVLRPPNTQHQHVVLQSRQGGICTDPAGAAGDPIAVIDNGAVRRNQVLEQISAFAAGRDMVNTAG